GFVLIVEDRVREAEFLGHRLAPESYLGNRGRFVKYIIRTDFLLALTLFRLRRRARTRQQAADLVELFELRVLDAHFAALAVHMADVDVEAQRALQVELQRLGVDVLLFGHILRASLAGLGVLRQRLGLAHRQAL